MPHRIELFPEMNGKTDGECLQRECRERIDWHEHDKPPPGWATVTVRRWGKRGSVEKTGVVCPKHTVGFVLRQEALF
jgi:hypothetical protein